MDSSLAVPAVIQESFGTPLGARSASLCLSFLLCDVRRATVYFIGLAHEEEEGAHAVLGVWPDPRPW